MARRKLMLMGLDCAPPAIIFDRMKGDLPNLEAMMGTGLYGPLRSTIPPITIPAWLVMMSGRSPGRLGLYGFRHRTKFSYDDMWIANSTRMHAPTVWDLLGDEGMRSVIIGVPPSYPPKEMNGVSVGCFITPTTEGEYTYPPEAKAEVERVSGGYITDIEFRTEDRDKLLRELYEMTDRRAKVVRHYAEKGDWDFMMFVEIGLDRINHAFWKFYDTQHHLYEPGNRYEDAIPDYYRHLDGIVGELLEILDDDTLLLATSDHGAKGMRGALCINQWLEEEGLLKFKSKPEGISKFEQCEVDWENTTAWGWGGYYARIFVNVEGREPKGIVPQSDYERVRDDLIARIEAIPDMDGRPLDTFVLKPEQVYKVTNGDYPDLMVFLDDLYWRAAGTVGHPDKYLRENDTGPDDAVHDWNGIIIYKDPKRPAGRPLVGAKLIDVAPTILKLMGASVPPDLDGSPIQPIIDLSNEVSE
ncbi:MAG: nucleotide pyrophosphatase [Thermoplasmata archaeon]|nr:nucleotide pyrophosphatase [Thermoplasmata archaeon]